MESKRIQQYESIELTYISVYAFTNI